MCCFEERKRQSIKEETTWNDGLFAAKRADFAAIGKEFGIDPVIARLIRNRDVQDRDEIRRYLYGTVEELASPHLMKDVDKAVQILQNKIKKKKRIRIIRRL